MEYKEVVVAQVRELPDGTMKQVAVEGGEILLTSVKGEISALGAFCTHYETHREWDCSVFLDQAGEFDPSLCGAHAELGRNYL